jgi:hypothetical protein
MLVWEHLHGEIAESWWMHNSVSCCRWDPPVLERFWSPWNAQALQPKLPTLGCSTASTISDRIVSSIGYGPSGLLFYWMAYHLYVLETVLSLTMWVRSFYYWSEALDWNFCLLFLLLNALQMRSAYQMAFGSIAILMHHFSVCSLLHYSVQTLSLGGLGVGTESDTCSFRW